MISIEEKIQVARLESAIEFKEARIKRLQKIAKAADTDFWESLKEDITLSIKSAEENRKMLSRGQATPRTEADDFRSLTRFYGGQELALEGVIANVDRAKEKIEDLNQEIAQHREQIRGIRAQLEPGKATQRRGGII